MTEEQVLDRTLRLPDDYTHKPLTEYVGIDEDGKIHLTPHVRFRGGKVYDVHHAYVLYDSSHNYILWPSDLTIVHVVKRRIAEAGP